MAQWQQYEIWLKKADNKWEVLGVFQDARVASALAHERGGRVRVIELIYEGNKRLSQEIIADLGHFENTQFAGGPRPRGSYPQS